MDLSATLIELKPGTTSLVEDWRKFISENLNLALDSIRSEGVEIESWFLVQLEGKDYLLCYMRANSLKNAIEVGSTSENPVDVVHKQFLRTACVGRAASGKLLVDLNVI
jgi:hypothetical protein